MNAVLLLVRRAWPALVGAMLVAGALPARADDVTTLSGTTYHDVHVVRVDPDGITWEHATGMVKVDFADLPDPVRRAYHYDATKAKVYQEAQARAQAEFAARSQQAQHDAEARRVQRFQSQAGESRPGEFVLRRQASEAQAVDAVGAGIADRKAAEAFRTKDDGTVWDRRLWAIPKYIFGGNEFDGVAFDPKTDLNSHEFKVSLHHSPGGFAPDAAHDAFFQPNYQTKSYYEDVERAEAFARGRP